MTILRRFLWLSLAIAIVPVTAGGQGRAGGGPPAPAGGIPGGPLATLPRGSGAISGVVVDGSTGAPVAGAVVMLAGLSGLSAPANSPLPTSPTRQVTDAKGRFAFVNLPAAPNFTLMASKAGYINGTYGQEKSLTDVLREISVRDGEWVSTIRVPLWRPGAISGTVRDERGEPVAGVYVRAYVRAPVMGREELAAGPLATTDDRGMYRMSGLNPARYVVAVPSVQAAAPASLPFNFAPLASVIDGAVDLEGTTSRLFLGRYPLPPPPVNGRRLVYPMMFHPSVSSVTQAATIDLKLGDDRAGIDVTLDPVAAVRVSGVVEGPAEALKNLTVRLLPVGLENLGAGSEAATALVDEGGRFTFVNVPSGAYVLDAPRTIGEYGWGGGVGLGRTMPAPPSRQGGWSSSGFPTDTQGLSLTVTDYRSGAGDYSGRAALTVGSSDLTNVVLTLRAQTWLAGFFILDRDPATPQAPAPTRFNARAEPANGNPGLGLPRTVYDPDDPPDEFTINGLGPGEYWLRVPRSGAWMVKSIRWKGRDYTDTPFDSTSGNIGGVEVTMTNLVTTLSGTLRQTSGAPAPGATVLIFPANRALWANTGLQPPRFSTATGTGSGTYKVTYVPAGDYLIAAVPASPGVWRTPEFLDRLERVATRITLTWGATTTQDLTVREVK